MAWRVVHLFSCSFWLALLFSADGQQCNLNQTVVDHIQSYQGVVNQIIDLFMTGAFKGLTYDKLAQLTDTFGHRQSGSAVLEDAIDWIVQESLAAGFGNVYTENVTIPYWVRNDESVMLTSPRQEPLPYLGFGSSVATPEGGIEADVLVVSSFEDLDQNAALVPGKIVVFDVPFTTYDEVSDYRFYGADAASEYGALAALVRSLTDFSIDSPHTGVLYYDDSVPQIPSGAITVEDATMLHRMQDRGDQVRVRLIMNAETLPDTTSRNVIIEVPGAVAPSEVVVVSGHLDSWDVGTGVMDDAGGCVISWIAGLALMDLGLIPQRTLRAVMFTAEETGIYGGREHLLSYGGNLGGIQLMLESDGGLWQTFGLGFNGTEEATCMMQEVLSLMSAINATLLTDEVSVPDLNSFQFFGVPVGSPLVADDRYFWFHHSEGDSMEVVDSDELDQCAALWTAVAYVTADMMYRLPRDMPQMNV